MNRSPFFGLKPLIQAAVITFFAASAAHAQQAVQWKVSDGGNGHWYLLARTVPGAQHWTWSAAEAEASSRGAHLVTFGSEAENSAVYSHLGLANALDCVAWIGLSQDPGSPEPAGGWRWTTGEATGFLNWKPGYPDDAGCSIVGNHQDYAVIGSGGDPRWDDAGDPTPNCPYGTPFAVFEFEGDCNNDGIVDYGQCRDGSLPDYDGDNTPDCCEAGTPCVIGNYPVQWRVADGGNGHWYCAHVKPQAVSWVDAKTLAVSLGGHLATLSTASENDWVFDRCARGSGGWECGGDCYGPWLGGFQDSSAVDYEEPAGGWRWVTGEPWSFTAWAPSLPNNAGNQNWLHFYGSPKLDGPFTPGPRWDDVEFNWFMIRSLVIEWSADCNNDGIVDYGQILHGQLADANADGIPDICQAPTCVDADLFRDFNVDGADIGILLAQWGPNTPLTVSDINDDGIVDGADLGLLLSFWGVCPN